MFELLSKIYTHTTEEIRNQNLQITNENIILLEEIFKEIFITSKLPEKSTIVADCINVLEKISIELVEYGYFTNASQLITNLYKISNDKAINFQLYLDNALFSLLYSLKDIKDDFILRKMSFNTLFTEMYKNALLENNIEFDKYIVSVFNRLYYQIMQNKYISQDEKQLHIKKLIDNILTTRYMNGTEDNNYEDLNTIERILLTLLITALNHKDKETFVYLWSKVNNEQNLGEDFDRIILIVSIYSYYISYKEDLVNKEEYKNLLNHYMDISNHFYEWDYTDYIWGNLDKTKSFLKNFEIMPENREAKWLIIENVIDEYYLFYCASVNPEHISKLNFDSITSILLRYNTYEEDQKLLTSYQDFKSFFNLDNGNADSKYELIAVFNTLKDMYYINLMANLKELDIALKTNSNILLEAKTEEFNQESLARVLAGTNIDDPTSLKEESLVIPIPIQLLSNDSEKQRLVNEYKNKKLQDTLDSIIIRELIKMSSEKKTHFKLDYKANNKINFLRTEIDKLAQKDGNHIHLYTGVKENAISLYKESIKEKDYYKNSLQDYTIIFNPRQTKSWFLFNPLQIELYLNEIYIIYRDLSSSELDKILEKCQDSDGIYSLQLINSLNYTLSKIDAESYIRLNTKVIEIKFQYSLNLIDKDSIRLISW
ncbi:hypothetical protein AC622_03145 [Bacillus sp. FJAT-27916]|uniref:hypothetical protein n=1 Tax=Bacillus sp. FJAT-27916 TaxID=1679169 RepID=UPI000670BDEE|nr:hypothetical protein [Bacillus sp. FJAT-27916]KMY43374.1 hypothetical protein AC622_03145 [Bacillus sp. FJAT-27916]